MTTKTDITLPPLPGALVDVETEARAYARAAVEADRQDRMPSDDDVATACKSLGWDLDAQEESDMILLVRTVMSRYSSGQPAAVEADRRGRMPSDEEILALAESARVWVPMGSGPEKDRSLQALRSLITTALSRYSGGKPASCDCDDKSQCWEPCGDLGHDAEHAKLSSGQPAASAKPLKKSEFRKAVEAMRGKPVAPVALEPVGYVAAGLLSQYMKKCREPGVDMHLEHLPIANRPPRWMTGAVALYATPLAAQAQHPDDAAVEAFAAAMKAKLAQKRAEGRGGWEDKTQCSQDRLSLMLRGHVAKGDPVDVANFCMMLHQRGERISGRDAASPSAKDREDDEALADTQRAIIEAAERRGYERAIAECAQVARAAKGADHD